MDPIYPQETANTGENTGLLLNETAIQHLNATRKWTLFFAVLGFIMIGLMGLGFIGMLIASAIVPEAGLMAGIAVFYAIFMAIYFFPVFYLFKFSDEAKKAIAVRDQTAIEKSFAYLHKHFKITGIITIVILSLYILLLILIVSMGSMLTAFFM